MQSTIRINSVKLLLSFIGTSVVHDELSEGYPSSQVTVDMATSVVRAIDQGCSGVCTLTIKY